MKKLMKKLKLNKVSRKHLIVVVFVAVIFTLYGMNTRTFSVIQNEPIPVHLDYYTTIGTSNGAVHTWVKDAVLPNSLVEAGIDGTIGIGIVFTGINVELINIYLEIEGPTPDKYNLTESSEIAGAWGSTMDTSQLANGTYEFIFRVLVNTENLHPSPDIGGEELITLSSFDVDFQDGKGKILTGLPIEYVVIIVIVIGVILLGGNKARRSY